MIINYYLFRSSTSSKEARLTKLIRDSWVLHLDLELLRARYLMVFLHEDSVTLPTHWCRSWWCRRFSKARWQRWFAIDIPLSKVLKAGRTKWPLLHIIHNIRVQSVFVIILRLSAKQTHWNYITDCAWGDFGKLELSRLFLLFVMFVG